MSEIRKSLLPTLCGGLNTRQCMVPGLFISQDNIIGKMSGGLIVNVASAKNGIGSKRAKEHLAMEMENEGMNLAPSTAPAPAWFILRLAGSSMSPDLKPTPNAKARPAIAAKCQTTPARSEEK